MVFSSLFFLLIFMPVVFIIYYILPKRNLRNIWLFITSLIFYSWGEPIYIFLMLFSTINDFIFSNLVFNAKENKKYLKAKIFFVISLVINILLLMFFKYSNFLISNLNVLFDLNIKSLNLILPIGISFYTFQTMSYSIDVYRGKVKAQRNFISLATYVTMFPQLIAGPIVRYITIENELTNRKESLSMFSGGLRRFIVGLSKKVLIANQMGLIVDSIYQNSANGNATYLLWLAAIAYTFQIYFDFSGYSDMAIGLGKMFGFNFLENFNYPYISDSITDFWRRWHISLSSWFKDYVYIPLGGNRKFFIRNLLIVWFLTGLWHGASWNFIFWGLYYGILLLVEKLVLSKIKKNIPKILKHFYTLFFIVIGWVIFRIENLSELKLIIADMFKYKPILFKDFILLYQDIFSAIPWLIVAVIASIPIKNIAVRKVNDKNRKIVLFIRDILIIILFLLSIICLVGEQFNPFIYFRF